jgi:galactan 5-O-arabinofuranosyltransferase
MTITNNRAAFVGSPVRAPDLLSDVAMSNRAVQTGAVHMVAELAGAAVVGAFVSLAVQWSLGRWHVPMPSFAPMALSNVVIGILALAAFALSVRGRFGLMANVLSWVAISAFMTSALSLMLFGTRFYLGGITGDQLFRTEYVTRLTDSSGVADFAYADLPGYYPRGWFWMAGRFANLLNWPGWLAYKPFAILTMAVGSVLTYVIWCQVIHPRHALLATLAASTVGVASWAAYEPYAWVFGALIPPLAVIGWQYLIGDAQSPMPARHRHNWAAAVLLGGILGLLALFFTLLFVFFVLVLVLTSALGLVRARRDRVPLWPVTVHSAVRLTIIGVLALPAFLLQWAPYLWTFVRDPVSQTGALRYFPQAGAQFPFFHYPVDFAGVLGLIGLVWCIVQLREKVVAKGLLVVVGAGYLWYAISLAGAVVNLTLLPFKIQLVMDEALRCAGVFGLLDGAGWLYRRLVPRWRSTAMATVAAVSSLGVIGEMQTAPNRLSELVPYAYSSYYPSGYTPLGQRDVTQQGAWNQQLHDTIAALSAEPEHNLVVLSTQQEFLSFWPYWNFQTTVLEYANPLAKFDARRDTISRWARSSSSSEFLTALRTSSFRAPNVFVFTRQPDGFHLRVTKNVFPLSTDNEPYDVVFPVSLFGSPVFIHQDVGPFTVLVRRPRPLLSGVLPGRSTTETFPAAGYP